MENSQKGWVDMLLYVVGPVTPEQAPLILAAADKVLGELPKQWNGKVCGADLEGRLIELSMYCKENHIPHVDCHSFDGTGAVFFRNIVTPLEGPPSDFNGLDRRTFPTELIITEADVLFLFYAPDEDTLREVELLQNACQAAGRYCFLCPV